MEEREETRSDGVASEAGPPHAGQGRSRWSLDPRPRSRPCHFVRLVRYSGTEALKTRFQRNSRLTVLVSMACRIGETYFSGSCQKRCRFCSELNRYTRFR